MKSSGKIEESSRYLMSAAIVKAERISGATWEVRGPWDFPFRVDDESFQKRFEQL